MGIETWIRAPNHGVFRRAIRGHVPSECRKWVQSPRKHGRSFHPNDGLTGSNELLPVCRRYENFFSRGIPIRVRTLTHCLLIHELQQVTVEAVCVSEHQAMWRPFVCLEAASRYQERSLPAHSIDVCGHICVSVNDKSWQAELL